MPEPRPDGLASLDAQRVRARRTMPPARHPVTAAPAPAPAPIPVQPSPVATDEAPVRERPEAEAKLGPVGSPIKVTLYVDPEADDYMEAVRIQGLTARPKVDISRSAVVRLAMRRLMAEMNPGEVKALLERQQVATGPGRKRR